MNASNRGRGNAHKGSPTPRLNPGFIFDLARQAQIEIPERGDKRPINCPFHDDRTASAFVSVANVFYCSVCTSDGGWSAKRFAQELGLPWPPSSSGRTYAIPASRAREPKAAPTFSPAEAQRVWRTAQRHARDDDEVAAAQPVFDYLAARGLAESWEEPGYGVLTPGMDLPSTISWWPGSDYRLVLPLFDLRGELVNVQARSLDPTKKPKVVFPKASVARGCLFANEGGLRLLRGAETTSERVILGEGFTDFLALGIATSKPVLCAPGTSLMPSIVGRWAASREVFVAPDMDDAGDATLRPVARELFRAGAARVLSITWPEGCNDACDAIVQLGASGFAEFLERILEGSPV